MATLYNVTRHGERGNPKRLTLMQTRLHAEDRAVFGTLQLFGKRGTRVEVELALREIKGLRDDLDRILKSSFVKEHAPKGWDSEEP